MHKSQLEKARDILAQITDPGQIGQELGYIVGTIVTLDRGMSTHVGILRRNTEYGARTWEVTYQIHPHMDVPVLIPFDSWLVERLDWDTIHDRPFIQIYPFPIGVAMDRQYRSSKATEA